MKKRIGRKQLIANLKEAQRSERTAKADLQMKEQELERMNDRFRELGKNTETIDGSGPVKCIIREIEPIPYGEYMVGNDGGNEYIRNELAHQIAMGLMEENIVQFIYKRPGQWDGPLGMPVTAVKLYVVPWEQMAVSRKSKLVMKPY